MVSNYNHPLADLIEEGDHMVEHLGLVRAGNLVAPFRKKATSLSETIVPRYLCTFSLNLLRTIPISAVLG